LCQKDRHDDIPAITITRAKPGLQTTNFLIIRTMDSDNYRNDPLFYLTLSGRLSACVCRQPEWEKTGFYGEDKDAGRTTVV
jgi:hypothetical protein